MRGSTGKIQCGFNQVIQTQLLCYHIG